MREIEVIEQFCGAARGRGLILDPTTIIADGKIHRCRTEGAKSGARNGSYVLHLDDHPAGGFDNWADGYGWMSWYARSEKQPSPEERAAWNARAAAIQLQRKAEEEQRYAEAAKRAMRLLSRSRPATNDHPYLRRKGVNAYGVRQLREQLVIPLRDIHGALWTLQFIGPDGAKKFLTGGRKRGCYFPIGKPQGVICICEGYATGASVFMATGYATSIAFDAGNLEPVARALRGKFPDSTIVLCADNDAYTPGNPGVRLATAAARAVRGLVAIPQFGEVMQ